MVAVVSLLRFSSFAFDAFNMSNSVNFIHRTYKCVVVPFRRKLNSNRNKKQQKKTCKNERERDAMKKRKQIVILEAIEEIFDFKSAILIARSQSKSQSVLSQHHGYQVDEHNKMHFFWIEQQQRHTTTEEEEREKKIHMYGSHIDMPPANLKVYIQFIWRLLFCTCYFSASRLFSLQLSSYTPIITDLSTLTLLICTFSIIFFLFSSASSSSSSSWCMSFRLCDRFRMVGHFPRKCSMNLATMRKRQDERLHTEPNANANWW